MPDELKVVGYYLPLEQMAEDMIAEARTRETDLPHVDIRIRARGKNVDFELEEFLKLIGIEE